MGYRGAVSLPLTLRAFMITQTERDAIEHWLPDDLVEEGELSQARALSLIAVSCCLWRLDLTWW